ncbi:MAG TPA: M12 family metallo-peptidase [Planctomycetota bacterium]|jgi:hypothetical protein|nr:hypothetical protein [Planctomycetota bacterium]MDP7246536.1 M12 family metallo-peptidase [Planctomycetota bacterium]HJM39915.1 M12 family metallo-peptidase [Planctomycetota bacterium]|tara:strand:- start:17999 stop:19570 length:1572 start_codon:yes stop_codon:yes gene_type:complete
MNILPLIAAIPLAFSSGNTPANEPATTLEENFFAWSLQSLELPSNPVDDFQVRLVLDEVFDTELLLTKYSVRSQNFVAYEQREDGKLYAIETPEIRTYRGVIAGIPGSTVSASLRKTGLHARIDLGDGSPVRMVQPLSDFDGSAVSDVHVIYNTADMVPDDKWVMAESLIPPNYQSDPVSPFNGGNHGGSHAPGSGNNQHVSPGSLNGNQRADKTVELAVDADYKYFQSNGNSSNNTIADIEDVINDVEAIYQNDVSICYDITTVIVRTSSGSDPYTSNNSSTLLNQFRAEWNSNQGSVQRDFAQLFTGRSISGSVIGIAWLGVVCNSGYGYSMVQSKYTNNMSRRVSLSAHELGHNWNADHCCSSCSGCGSCHIMCPCNGGCSGNVSKFGSSSISSINSHKNSRNCLDSGCNGGGGGGGPLTITNPSPGYAGVVNSLTVAGGTANGSGTLYYSATTGFASTPCTSVYVGLNNPKVAGTVNFDSSGNGSFSKTVPARAAGRTIYIQFVDTTGCELSNMVTEVF